MRRITPFLWFDGQAEEAANYYVSIFKNSKVLNVNPMSATFELDGQTFYALNGGPKYQFTEAVSFFITCENQEEIDYYWNKLREGGEEQMCGWLKDKFGLSWQVVPSILGELMSDPAVVQELMQMRKIDIQRLKTAKATI